MFGGFIDLALTRDELHIAIEVSHKNYAGFEITNIQKCIKPGYFCLMVSEHPDHLRAIRAKATTELSDDELNRVEFFSPEETEAFLARQPSSKCSEPTYLGFRTIIIQAKSSDAVIALKTFQLARFIARNINKEAE